MSRGTREHGHNVVTSRPTRGQSVCTRTWLWLSLLLLLWLWLLLLLFGEAAQSGLAIPRSGHERGQLARLSRILGFQVIFKQWLGE